MLTLITHVEMTAGLFVYSTSPTARLSNKAAFTVKVDKNIDTNSTRILKTDENVSEFVILERRATPVTVLALSCKWM